MSNLNDDVSRETFSAEKLYNVSRETFEKYFKILIERNKEFNLTSITDKEEVIYKHFVDSLEIVRAIPNIANINAKLIDVGTGAGFPGIPIAIAFPNLEITLTDSLNKRINFLNEVVEKLGLKNIKTIHSRAEDLGNNAEHREKYDYSTARAVANLSTLAEYCAPFIHTGGKFIAYKSAEVDAEIMSAANAFKVLGLCEETRISYELPNEMGKRTLIVVDKRHPTPKKYPRKAGTPSKTPL